LLCILGGGAYVYNHKSFAFLVLEGSLEEPSELAFPVRRSDLALELPV